MQPVRQARGGVKRSATGEGGSRPLGAQPQGAAPPGAKASATEAQMGRDAQRPDAQLDSAVRHRPETPDTGHCNVGRAPMRDAGHGHDKARVDQAARTVRVHPRWTASYLPKANHR